MSTLEALRYEREGYVRRGLKDRVAAVDAAIRRLGGVVETTEADKTVETADVPSRRRSAR